MDITTVLRVVLIIACAKRFLVADDNTHEVVVNTADVLPAGCSPLAAANVVTLAPSAVEALFTLLCTESLIRAVLCVRAATGDSLSACAAYVREVRAGVAVPADLSSL